MTKSCLCGGYSFGIEVLHACLSICGHLSCEECSKRRIEGHDCPCSEYLPKCDLKIPDASCGDGCILLTCKNCSRHSIIEWKKCC